MSPRIRSFLAVTSVLLASFTLGCSEAGDPVAAAPAESPFLSSGAGPSLDVLARFQKRPQITIAWAKKWIGPEGGRLDFQGFAIEVPAGAVDKVTAFTLRLPVDPKGSERVVAEFGPHGSNFLKPIYIEFPYAGTSIAGSPSARVVWWDGTWVNIGGTVTADGQRIRAATDHFSTYGTSSDIGIGQATSGG